MWCSISDPLIAESVRAAWASCPADAWALGVVGPWRGSGLDIDVRKNTPYLVYPDLYFDIVKEQTATSGRAMVRVRRCSVIRLLRQCPDKLPEGLAVHMGTVEPDPSPAQARAAIYLQTNGTPPPQVARAVPMNWGGLTVMMKDCQLADIPVIVSIDPCVSCTERWGLK